MNIYVGNLPYAISENALKELFATYGEVVTAKIIKDKLTNKSKGFGFIEMIDTQTGNAAITALQGHRLEGRALKISEARTAQETTNERGYERKPRF